MTNLISAGNIERVKTGEKLKECKKKQEECKGQQAADRNQWNKSKRSWQDIAVGHVVRQPCVQEDNRDDDTDKCNKMITQLS